MTYSDETKQAFLDALARCGVIGDAMRAAGIKARLTIKNWRDDPAFNEAYLEAIDDATDTLEAEARRRAVDGVIRTKSIGSGKDAQIIDEVQYSDTLLLALLKAKKPDEFADRSKTELTNPDGSFKPQNETEAAVRIAALLDAARKRKDGAAEADPLFE